MGIFVVLRNTLLKSFVAFLAGAQALCAVHDLADLALVSLFDSMIDLVVVRPEKFQEGLVALA